MGRALFFGMPFLASVWLLLQLLAGATAFPRSGAFRTGDRASLAFMAERPAQASATQSRAPSEALHASLVLPSTSIARLGWRLPMGTAPAFPVRHAVARWSLARTAQERLHTAGLHTHRVAARGTLLPYLPTAPPHPA
jgi:hypothetical protein